MKISEKDFQRVAKAIRNRKELQIESDSDAIELIECLEPHSVPLYGNDIDVNILEHLVETCHLTPIQSSWNEFNSGYVLIGSIKLSQHIGDTILSIPSEIYIE